MAGLAFVVPGRLDQITGGYIYDRRVVGRLREIGRAVEVVELPGRYPEPDAEAFAAAAALLDRADAPLCIDGLALAAFDGLPAHPHRARAIVLVHHPLAQETGLDAAAVERFRAIERRLLTACRGVICPSPASAAGVGEYGVQAERIRIVPPGLDHPVPMSGAERTGPLRLLSVGTVTPRKGHLLLVRALARLAASDWRLTILGSLERNPETAALLRETVARTGLGDRVILAGEWPPARLAEAYRAADLFVLPSYHEGYGMAYTEAMAFGLPIIGTTAGAIADTVPPSAGLLVPPGDEAALASALGRLIGDAALRRSLAAGALAAAGRLPGWDETGDRFAAALDALMA
ncbi:MAG TPA: glycosyltransferase family 4 protein [Aliidongia sp.]|nr:glycosyltransferase family 4 protein [Aliidongia sp.]